jgi:hypothetical protein
MMPVAPFVAVARLASAPQQQARERTGHIIGPADRPAAIITLNDGWAKLRESLFRPIGTIGEVSQSTALTRGYVTVLLGSPLFSGQVSAASRAKKG